MDALSALLGDRGDRLLRTQLAMMYMVQTKRSVPYSSFDLRDAFRAADQIMQHEKATPVSKDPVSSDGDW